MTQPTTNRKVALITGANRGIGLQIAKDFAARGFLVLMGSRDKKKGEGAAKSIPDARVLTLDVADEKSIIAAAALARTHADHIDVLVNNAGILVPDKTTPPQKISDADLTQTIKVNVIGAHLVIKHFLPMLEKSAHGRIINISSICGQFTGTFEYNLPYCVSKSALNMLTVQWAFSLRNKIAVNAVSPGWVKTDMGGVEAPGEIEQGSDTAVWLATIAPESLTGKFFEDRKEIDW